MGRGAHGRGLPQRRPVAGWGAHARQGEQRVQPEVPARRRRLRGGIARPPPPAGGMVLTLFRFSEYISPTDGDKKLFRLVMQDEARHVGYGMQHLKWVLDHFPEKREIIHKHLDEAENFVFGGAYAVEVMEPFIILSGK